MRRRAFPLLLLALAVAMGAAMGACIIGPKHDDPLGAPPKETYDVGSAGDTTVSDETTGDAPLTAPDASTEGGGFDVATDTAADAGDAGDGGCPDGGDGGDSEAGRCDDGGTDAVSDGTTGG